jgi:hypothetical protein
MYLCLRAASAVLLLAGAAAAEPRSAIQWLSDSLHALPAPARAPAAARPRAEAGIEVTALAAPPVDGVGLLSPRVTGLPQNLWGSTSALRARSLLLAVRATGVPSAQDLFRTLLLAGADPPPGTGPGAPLLRTRIDRLMEMGALEEAYELLVLSGVSTPDFLLRGFDIALLTGQESRACEALLGRADVRPTASARIFCLARGNAWPEAVVALAVAREAGELSPADAELFARFLETEETPAGTRITLPERLTPLAYVMLTAIGAAGEAAGEAGVPVAFRTLDLAPSATPRARILAAEHLVASGGVSYPILFYAYRVPVPAASGGVWARAAAVQDLDVAIQAGDGAEIARSLPVADQLLGEVGLRTALAREYAPALAALPPDPRLERARMAALLLLGGETAAAHAWVDATLPARYRAALAVADPGFRPGEVRAGTIEDAVLAAFAAAPPDGEPWPELSALLAGGRVGEALLRALAILDARSGVDPGDLTVALRTLAAAGQVEAARRIAVETLLEVEDG